MSRPLRVYLDSNDYSVLSNPRSIDAAKITTLQHLRRWSKDGEIECYFSGTLLCEIAPLDAAASLLASARAELLVELCGRKALVSQDRLIAAELSFALNITPTPAVAYSPRGDWYPDGSRDILPITDFDLGCDIKDLLRQEGMSRQQRRQAERCMLKAGKPKAAVQTQITERALKVALDSLLREFPMRPQDARTLMRFFAGDAKAEDAIEAFQEALRDPAWMLDWFRTQPDKLTPFIQWVRGPASMLMPTILNFRELSIKIRQATESLGSELADSLQSREGSTKWQDGIFANVANRVANGLLSVPHSMLTPLLIDKKCPGLSTGIRAVLSAWWQSTGDTPRMPLPSDYPDALHAMYAPYVDIFRADSFMAPHIRRQVKPYGTIVVQKLSQLIPTIEGALRERAEAQYSVQSAPLRQAS